MSQSVSERRMGENEVVFRTYNERVLKGLSDLKTNAEQDGMESLLRIDDTPLQFYCECADEDCQKRIKLKPSRYEEIHKKRDHFIIVGGHENNKIERIVGKENGLYVVKKLIELPASATVLQKTALDNS